MSPKSVALIVLLLGSIAFAGGVEVGQPGPGFALSHGSESVSLKGLLDAQGTSAVVVVFASYTCPFSLRAEGELLLLAGDLAGKGVKLVALYPNATETVEGMAAHAKEQSLPWLCVRDEGGRVTREWGVEVTPTFHLVDRGGVVRFRGGLAGLNPAVAQLLAGEAIAMPLTPATGCTVKWAAAAAPEAPAPGPSPAAPPPAPAPDRPRARPEGRPDRAPRVRPEGPAAELSPGARTWLAVLIGSLSSDDEMVRRSAVAGIAALGPAALPALRAARANAEGTLAEDLDRAIARLSERPGGAPGGRGGEGGAPGGPGGPGGAGARRFGGLDMQKQFLVENLDLTAEQTTALDAAIEALREREAELQKLREAGTGDPTLMREGYRALMEDLRKALDGILTPEQAAKLQELRESRGRRPR
ncbi:MAG: redoxin family protein [Planctomycetes bacterium]|jgi:hypothetical protein|nr:redoxin family protein [Planctomycetota bacterium]